MTRCNALASVHAGLFAPARRLAERGRVLRRLLRPAPPIPLHRDEAIAPFFVVGSGRCSTTLLRRLLMAGDEERVIEEGAYGELRGLE